MEDEMTYSYDTLKAKIIDFYPEIEKHQLQTSLTFDKDKNAYVIKIKKGKHELTTFLDKPDADSCIEGKKCVYLGLHIAEFVKNFEIEEEEEKK
jgi:predicted transport protein